MLKSPLLHYVTQANEWRGFGCLAGDDWWQTTQDIRVISQIQQKPSAACAIVACVSGAKSCHQRHCGMCREIIQSYRLRGSRWAARLYLSTFLPRGLTWIILTVAPTRKCKLVCTVRLRPMRCSNRLRCWCKLLEQNFTVRKLETSIVGFATVLEILTALRNNVNAFWTTSRAYSYAVCSATAL